MSLSRTFTHLPDSKYVIGSGTPRVRAEQGDPGFVYFIQIGQDGPIKIGWTVEPYERLKALQTGAPYELSLLGVISGGRKDEARLHAALADHRLRGEWFKDCREVREAMRASVLPVERRTTSQTWAGAGEHCLNCGTLLVVGEDWLCKACVEFIDDWATPEFKAAWREHRELLAA